MALRRAFVSATSVISTVAHERQTTEPSGFDILQNQPVSMYVYINISIRLQHVVRNSEFRRTQEAKTCGLSPISRKIIRTYIMIIIYCSLQFEPLRRKGSTYLPYIIEIHRKQETTYTHRINRNTEIICNKYRFFFTR